MTLIERIYFQANLLWAERLKGGLSDEAILLYKAVEETLIESAVQLRETNKASIDPIIIRLQAEREIGWEEFDKNVAAMKVRIKNRKPWYQRLFPFKLTITRAYDNS